MNFLPVIPPENVYENNNEPRLIAAIALYDEEKWTEAALALEPIANDGNLLAIFKYANTLEEIGELAAAEHYWRVAVGAGDANSANNLANLMKRQSRTEEVTSLYELAIELGCLDALRNLGIWIEDENPARAEALFQEAVASEVAGSCANLGKLLLDQGRESEAMEQFNLGVSRGEFYSAALLAVHFYLQKEYEAVIKVIQENQWIWESHSFFDANHPYKLLVLSLFFLGRSDEAANALEECRAVGVPDLFELDQLFSLRADANGASFGKVSPSRQRTKPGFSDPYSRNGT